MVNSKSHRKLRYKWKFIPISPSMIFNFRKSTSNRKHPLGYRTVKLSAAAICIAIVAALSAQFLTHLIGFFTNLFFFQRISFDFVSPAESHNWGLWIIPIPVFGGLIIGIMARFGSKAIRGHGIPEAMEQILTNKSLIPIRVTFLKPLSAAISIGTGGPFGAEGPIIATGAAFGSVLGQILRTSSQNRKYLLAAGAAAGMTATFGSPVSAVLLAVELLLFEFSPQSLIPVSFAVAVAEAIRILFVGTGPVFFMAKFPIISAESFLFFAFLGSLIGVASVGATKAIYFIEDSFEKLPVHWMWWPALGGFAVGGIGYFYPETMGVGYENIEAILNGKFTYSFLVAFCFWKFVSWSVALGSGTSGGTLAPLFMIGGCIGALVYYAFSYISPNLGLGPEIAALVGMASMFAGSSRALLTSVVFAFEVTQQPHSLMPLLAGCATSYLVSGILMKNSIMTEKITRRGILVPTIYESDSWGLRCVKDIATQNVIFLLEDQSVEEVRAAILAQEPPYIHQGYPVLSKGRKIVGLVTRDDFHRLREVRKECIGEMISSQPIFIETDCTLREAAEIMKRYKVGRLPVASKDGLLVGIVSRSDLIEADSSQS